MPKLKDLTGKRFGRWVVLKRGGYDSWKNLKWLCRCDCGTEREVLGLSLRNGTSLSCGCIQKETAHSLGTHYMTKTRLYKIWENIHSRCLNPKNDSFYKYGARGVSLCEEWKNSFESFRDWALSNGYRDDLTIDRIDNDGNYEPSNCRWVDCKTQSRNTRRNHYVTYNNETKCISEWDEIFKIPRSTLYYRLKKNNWRIPIDLRRDFATNA